MFDSGDLDLGGRGEWDASTNGTDTGLRLHQGEPWPVVARLPRYRGRLPVPGRRRGQGRRQAAPGRLAGPARPGVAAPAQHGQGSQPRLRLVHAFADRPRRADLTSGSAGSVTTASRASTGSVPSGPVTKLRSPLSWPGGGVPATDDSLDVAPGIRAIASARIASSLMTITFPETGA